MRNLFGREHFGDLARFLAEAEKPLFAFDFDGTLVGITDSPDQVEFGPTMAQLLNRLAALAPVAVVSGRSQKDLAQHLKETTIPHLVGNHGSDWDACRDHHERWREDVSTWASYLRGRLASESGVMIEDKEISLSIHYRQALAPTLARERIMNIICAIPGIKVLEGKLVINLIPEKSPHKGDALRELMKRTQCKEAIFVGDDITDEDAFSSAIGHHTQFMTIRVEKSSSSAARFYLESQHEMARLLETLAQIMEFKLRG